MSSFSGNQGSTLIIDGVIEDENRDPVALAAIDEATLTYYDMGTGNLAVSPVLGIINGRHEQNVKNANNVVIADGTFTWTLQVEDANIVTARRQVERHLAVFTFTLSNGNTVVSRHEIDVTNMGLGTSS